jgi:hypothetical protein
MNNDAIITDIRLRFIDKGLIKGYKRMINSGIHLSQMEDFIKTQIDVAKKKKNIGEILSLIYTSGELFGQDIISLLKRLYINRDYPTFLKQAYRFNIYEELKDDIDFSIKWHKSRNLPDAFSWEVKFKSLKLQNERILSPQDNTPIIDKGDATLEVICEEESINTKQFVSLKLQPIVRKEKSKLTNLDTKLTTDTEKYINTQYEKKKLDQANMSHRATQGVIEAYLDIFSIEHIETKHIDLFAEINNKSFVFEIKSITERNERPQTREAVGQLHEYAFLYGLDEPELFVVYSSKPSAEWIIQYLESREKINVIWICNEAKDKLAGPGLKRLEQHCIKHYKNYSLNKAQIK